MPIRIQNDLPAKKVLQNENIFVMSHERAVAQDIRPLKIAILNIMPTKIITETQLARVLGNTPLQVEIDFVHTASYHSKNTSENHINEFYTDFNSIKNNKYEVNPYICFYIQFKFLYNCGIL